MPDDDIIVKQDGVDRYEREGLLPVPTMPNYSRVMKKAKKKLDLRRENFYGTDLDVIPDRFINEHNIDNAGIMQFLMQRYAPPLPPEEEPQGVKIPNWNVDSDKGVSPLDLWEYEGENDPLLISRKLKLNNKKQNKLKI